ncbi:molybdopterin-dependent oxidoreductase [Adlercreutzia sp. ZJ473]|uniref:molybdopterin-dependent oxidoreductase n=1 Tax=Adlercreutzia sp. ZJ473 TaxID=2722822 RepID=UPI0015545828|nr:molybdopterin-dependent oxidoreductase [Adlercreutzia sp. ZJ473]
MPTYNPELYRKEKHWKEGEFDVYRNAHWSGPGCHEGCGLLWYVKDGKVDHIEGDPNDAFNRGRLCMRCLNMVDEGINNTEQRLKRPLKRVGKRGENKWEEISWDEAYSIIEEHVHDAWDTVGPLSIIVMEGTGRNVCWQVPLLGFSAFRTPQFSCGFLSGDSCYLPRCSSSVLIMGGPAVVDCGQFSQERYDHPEYEYPEVILSWGSNSLVSNKEALLGHWFIDCARNGGTKFLNVDTRVTWLSAHSEAYLQPRPGTDGALAMAMLNVIISEDLYDHEFVEKWCFGFDDLRECVKDWTPERAGEIAGCDPEDIKMIARIYATAKTAAFDWGVATDQNVNGMAQTHAFMIMEAITGNVDVPGGNYLAGGAFGVNAMCACGLDQFISKDLQDQRIGLDKYPMHQYGMVPTVVPDLLLEQIETGEPYPIKMLYMAGTNPIACMGAEAPRVVEALQKVPFVVIADLWMTPTAVAAADLVLPVAMSCERNSYREWYQPSRAMTKLTQYGECKSDEQILADLSIRLNGENVPWTNEKEMLEWVLAKDNAPITWEDLSKNPDGAWAFPGYRRYETGKLRGDGKPGFNTPTGLIELRSTMMEAMGYHDLPYFQEPPESPVTRPDLFEEYPLVCTSGKRHDEFFHSEHRNMPTMREFRPNPEVDIHPNDAEKYGIKHGDWVWIENHRGRCKQTANVTPTIKEGVVCADHGWWFPENDPAELYNVFDVNINNLTTQGVFGEAGYGAPYRTILCKVYKCTSENSKVTPNQIIVESLKK